MEMMFFQSFLENRNPAFLIPFFHKFCKPLEPGSFMPSPALPTRSPAPPLLNSPGSPSEDESLRATWDWYLGFTAIGGLTHAGGTQYKVNSLLWLLLTVVGAGLTVWNVYKVVEDYLKKDVSEMKRCNGGSRIDVCLY